MEKEMNDAAEAGFRFAAVMGGDTAFGGSEVMVIMTRTADQSRVQYRLLATGKTSTMEKERGSSFYSAEKSRVRNN